MTPPPSSERLPFSDGSAPSEGRNASSEGLELHPAPPVRGVPSVVARRLTLDACPPRRRPPPDARRHPPGTGRRRRVRGRGRDAERRPGAAPPRPDEPRPRRARRPYAEHGRAPVPRGDPPALPEGEGRDALRVDDARSDRGR